MSRRVLLIDADPAFRDAVRQQLGRYRFDVVVQPEPDKALANADDAALIIVAVEEPDKAGFKVFQRCKKGPLAKVPIMLVTASIAPDSFSKHRGLKVHADDYIDKRAMKENELAGKVDKLIGLGELADDLDIPVDLDEIPLEIADGDVVLDETVGDDEGFDAPRTDAPRVDSAVDAETDAAFAAMMGDDASMMAPPIQESAVPAPIHDATHRDADSGVFDTFSRESMRLPPNIQPRELLDTGPHDSPEGGPDESRLRLIPANLTETDLPQAKVELDAPSRPRQFESSPAITLDSDELVPLDDGVPVDEAVPTPVPHPSEPIPQRERDDSKPFIETPTVNEARPAIPPIGAAPPRVTDPRSPASGPAPEARRAIVPADFGLDAIAQDAESEQSGVYDRRSLRKIAELERTVAQLKTELERARASADSSRGPGREREFLNLRETIIAKDSDLAKARSDVAGRDRELGEVRDKLRQAITAKTALEGKAAELAQELASSTGQLGSLEASHKMATAQVASLQHELDTKTSVAAAAETARSHLERELAAERARSAAGASEAERSLRVEREQMIARHQHEIAAVRNEALGARDAALAKLREELETAHGESVGAAVAAARDEAKAAAAGGHQAAIAAIHEEHAVELERLRATHAEELTTQQIEHQGTLSRLAEAQETELARAHEDHAAQVTHAAATRNRQIAELNAEIQKHRTAAEQALSSHIEAAARRKQEADAIAAQHAQELAAAEAAREELVAGHQHALAAAETAREALVAAHQHALAAAETAREELVAGHQHALAAAAEQHVQALSAANEQRERELAAAHVLREREVTEAHEQREREVAAAVEQRRRDLDGVRAKHAQEAERLQGALVAAHAEHEQAAEQHQGELAGAQAAHAADVERHQTELQALRASHVRALADAQTFHGEALEDQTAQHAEELVQRDRDHAEARQADAADHARAIKELKAELERQHTTHEARHEAVRQELEQRTAQHERDREQLADEHRRGLEGALASAAAQHAEESARLAEYHAATLDDVKRAAAEQAAIFERKIAELDGRLGDLSNTRDREAAEHVSALKNAKWMLDDATAKHHAELVQAGQSHEQATAELTAVHERAMAVTLGDHTKNVAVLKTEHRQAIESLTGEHERAAKATVAAHAKAIGDLTTERDEVKRGLSSTRDSLKRTETELATAVQTIADRNAELRAHAAAITERDQRIAELRKEIESLEHENANYQEQVLRAYQKIKSDEATVARARKAMAIALTVLDDQDKPSS